MLSSSTRVVLLQCVTASRMIRKRGPSRTTMRQLNQLLRSFRNTSLFRPFRMYQIRRSVVDVFQPGELLYRRYRRGDVKNGMLLPSALGFPKKGNNTGPSVTRSSFSRPEDARWSDKRRIVGAGVYQFPISCLPARSRCSDTAREFTFFPKHVPLWNNYAHSEVWCDSFPRRNAGYVLPTELVKKELRAQIQKSHRIAIQAEM